MEMGIYSGTAARKPYLDGAVQLRFLQSDAYIDSDRFSSDAAV